MILRAAQNPSLGLPFLLCLKRKAQGLAQALSGQYHHVIYWSQLLLEDWPQPQPTLVTKPP